MSPRSRRALERTRTVRERDRSEPPSVDPVDRARMRKALARLSRRERRILLAVRIEGLSYAEIAERTGLTETKVEQILAQAIGHALDTIAQDSWSRKRRIAWLHWLRRLWPISGRHDT